MASSSTLAPLAALLLSLSAWSAAVVSAQTSVGALVYNCQTGGYCPQYSGFKWTCSIRNLNSIPLNYPSLTTTNFAPSYTQNNISPLGTFLGYIGPNGDSCTFTFYNNLTTSGFPSFSVDPFLNYAYATVTTTSSVAGLAVSCSTPVYCPEGDQLVAKFSCKFINITPQTAYDVQLTGANFNPISTSGINFDATLPSNIYYPPYCSYSFSFNQLIFPSAAGPLTTITLQVSAANFFTT